MEVCFTRVYQQCTASQQVVWTASMEAISCDDCPTNNFMYSFHTLNTQEDKGKTHLNYKTYG